MVIRSRKETTTVTDIKPTKVAPIRAIDFGTKEKERVGGVTIRGGRVGGRRGGGGGSPKIISATDAASRAAAEELLRQEAAARAEAARQEELKKIREEQKQAAVRKEQLVLLSAEKTLEAREKQRLIKEAGLKSFREGEIQRVEARLKESRPTLIPKKEPKRNIVERVFVGAGKRIQKNIRNPRVTEQSLKTARTREFISQSVEEKGFIKTSKILLEKQKPAGIVFAAAETAAIPIQKLSSAITRKIGLPTSPEGDRIVRQRVGELFIFAGASPVFKTTVQVERSIAEQQRAIIFGGKQQIGEKTSSVAQIIKTTGGRQGASVAVVKSKTAGAVTVSRVDLAGQIGKQPPALKFPSGTVGTKGVQKFTAKALSVSIQKGQRVFFERTVGIVREGRKVTPFVGQAGGLAGSKVSVSAGIAQRVTGPSTNYFAIIKTLPKAVARPKTFEVLPRGLFIGPPKIAVPKATASAGVQTVQIAKSVTQSTSATLAAAVTPVVPQAPIAVIAPTVQTITQRTTPIQTAVPRQVPIVKTGAITKTKAITQVKTITKTRTRGIQGSSAATTTITNQIQTPKVITITPTIPKQTGKTRVPSIPTIVPPVTTQGVPIIPGFKLRGRVQAPRIRTFGVAVRRRGVFRPIGRGLRLQQAISVGATRVGGTIAATFRITPEQPGRITGVRTPKKFRRRRGLTFVELPKFRLDTPGEIRGIKNQRIKI